MDLKPICVLLIEDNPGEARLYREFLAQASVANFEVVHTNRLSTGLERLSERDIDVILLDLGLPDSQGLDTFTQVQAQARNTPIVVLTGLDDENLAMKAVQAGAQDYLTKGQVNSTLLSRSIRYAIERKQAEDELRKYANRLEILHRIDQAVLAAQSPQAIAKAALDHIRRLVACLRASLILFNSEAQEATVLHVDTEHEARFGVGTRIPMKTFASIDRLQKGLVLKVEDIGSLAEPTPVEEAILAEGVNSYISVPLLVKDDLIGILNLGGSSPSFFLPEDVDIAREVANSLGVALWQAQLFEQVQVGRKRLQTLAHRLVELQEVERRNIARELHDEIGQILTGLKLVLEMRTRLPAEEVRANVDKALALVNDLISRARDLSLDLRPAMLDDLGLLPALLWHFERFADLTNVRVAFRHNGLEGQRFPPEVETATYRIVQEALTNVARHANVEEVIVQIRVEGEILTAQIEDMGIGFDTEAAMKESATFGMVGMYERAIAVGGHLTVASNPGKGTRLIAELPLRDRLERRKKRRSV